MAELQLQIVTPEGRAFTDDVDQVVVPGVEGELGILPGHIPFVTIIKPGELKALQGGKTLALVVGDGFVEITGKHVVVLTDIALKAEEINENEVEEAIARAQQSLKEKHDNAEQQAIEATLRKSLVQLAFKRKRKG